MNLFGVIPHSRRLLALAAVLLVALAFVESSTAAERATTEPAATEPVTTEMDPLGDPLFDEFDDEFAAPAIFPDPFEGMNRRTFLFNQRLDHLLIGPVANVYRFVVPGQLRLGVRQILANLNSPAVLVNDLLQREWRDSGATTMRFALNSTIGVGGIFDPARDFGYEPHSSDFGQTMALEGVGSGPFLILPVFGPTTVRDGLGFLVDVMFQPTTYLLFGIDQIVHAAVRGGSSGIATRAANAEAIRALEESSVDYYAALRSAYYQHRTAEIWDRRESHREEVETAALE